VSAAAPSIFAPFAEAIRDGHRIAYNLPAQPKPARELNDLEKAQQSAATALCAYYDRPNGYSGD
jgi:hypothetical protein